MRIKIALFAAAAAITLLPAAMPAAAQSYRDCGNTRANNQAAGAVLGAVLGGVIGSNSAGRGHRGDGTAVGAVVGALAGSEIGRSGTDCRTRPYPQPLPPPPRGYNDGYSGGYDRLAGGPAYPYEGGYTYGPEDDPRDAGYTERYDLSRNGPVARRGRGQYNNADYAGSECSTASQITRLPDGTEIRRPVEACRDTYYGDWTIRN